MENISAHITYNQSVYSDTALRYNIQNIPTEENILNMEDLAVNIYEPIYLHFKGKIRINSFFRSKELNKILKGVSNSQHLALNGSAIDIESIDASLSNKDIFDLVLDNLVFDQLISEHANNIEPKWIHISFNKKNNRSQVIYT